MPITILRPTSASGRRRASPQSVHGFTLIESLVTIIVLSIGVLALANLQLQTLLDSRTAAMRNVAAAMAYNLTDQIRSNETALKAGNFNLPAKTAVANCYSTNGCLPAEMATESFSNWRDDLQAALPAGDGTVCIDSTPDDGTGSAAPACDNVAGAPYVVKIWWHEDRNTGLPPQRFVTALVP